jgi:hypothetical protein
VVSTDESVLCRLTRVSFLAFTPVIRDQLVIEVVLGMFLHNLSTRYWWISLVLNSRPSSTRAASPIRRHSVIQNWRLKYANCVMRFRVGMIGCCRELNVK